MTTGVTRANAGGDVRLQSPTLGWVLKRTLLAIGIMVVVVGGAAWLLHASIDSSAEERDARRSASTAITNAQLND